PSPEARPLGEGGTGFVAAVCVRDHWTEMTAEEHFTVSNRILLSRLFFSVGLVLTLAGTLLLWPDFQAK
ncbi:MAG: hypothetical protein ABL994_25995, partial [Verrucomicrobiales bacterium]